MTKNRRAVVASDERKGLASFMLATALMVAATGCAADVSTSEAVERTEQALIQGEEWETTTTVSVDPGTGRLVTGITGSTGLRDDTADPANRATCGFTRLSGYFGPETEPEIFVNAMGYLDLRVYQDPAVLTGAPVAQARMRCKRFTAFGVVDPASLDKREVDAADSSVPATADFTSTPGNYICPLQRIAGPLHFESPTGPPPGGGSTQSVSCGGAVVSIAPLVIGSGSMFADPIAWTSVDERVVVRSPYKQPECAMFLPVDHEARAKCFDNTTNPSGGWVFYPGAPTRFYQDDQWINGSLVFSLARAVPVDDFCYISSFSSPGVVAGFDPADIDFLIEIRPSTPPGMGGAYLQFNSLGPVGLVEVECLPLDQTVAPAP